MAEQNTFEKKGRRLLCKTLAEPIFDFANKPLLKKILGTCQGMTWNHSAIHVEGLISRL